MAGAQQQLRDAIEFRVLIGQAKAIFMERLTITADQAFQLLIQGSQVATPTSPTLPADSPKKAPWPTSSPHSGNAARPAQPRCHSSPAPAAGRAARSGQPCPDGLV